MMNYKLNEYILQKIVRKILWWGISLAKIQWFLGAPFASLNTVSASVFSRTELLVYRIVPHPYYAGKSKKIISSKNIRFAKSTVQYGTPKTSVREKVDALTVTNYWLLLLFYYILFPQFKSKFRFIYYITFFLLFIIQNF